jgi:hypothetical protein
MSNKSVLYIVIAIVLTVFLQSLRDVAVEFIKSTKEEDAGGLPGLFMIPGGMGPMMPSPSSKLNDGKTWAQTMNLE